MLTNFYQFVPSKFSADNLLPVCLPDHFFTQGVIASVRAHAKFSLSKYINGKTVVYSYSYASEYARLLYAFQTDQQSCDITYIASNLWLRNKNVTVLSHQLFISSAPYITVTLIDTCNRITPTRILHGFTLSSSTFMSLFVSFHDVLSAIIHPFM